MARFASVFFFATLALVGAGCQLLGHDADAPDPVAAALERMTADAQLAVDAKLASELQGLHGEIGRLREENRHLRAEAAGLRKAKERAVRRMFRKTRGDSARTPRRDGAADDDDGPTCLICMDARIEVVFLPCGHAYVCMQCGGTLAACPMCRSPVERAIRLYE